MHESFSSLPHFEQGIKQPGMTSLSLSDHITLVSDVKKTPPYFRRWRPVVKVSCVSFGEAALSRLVGRGPDVVTWTWDDVLKRFLAGFTGAGRHVVTPCWEGQSMIGPLWCPWRCRWLEYLCRETVVSES